ncbi:hypothetical protein CBF23_006785 [Marinomonas agarivorans]|nr:hypothetical protein CBF23_006785 [Marinomonas agarivorans]
MVVPAFQQTLCDALRDREHHSNHDDELFYCSYLLGLLALESHGDAATEEEFIHLFSSSLNKTMVQENLNEQDQEHILDLWRQVSKSQ